MNRVPFKFVNWATYVIIISSKYAWYKYVLNDK